MVDLTSIIEQINTAAAQAQAVVNGLTSELTLDQSQIDSMQASIDSLTSLNEQLQAELDTDSEIIEEENVQDKKEAVLDYLRGKGRLLRELPPTADETETIDVPLSYVSETPELYLVQQAFANAGHVYILNTL